MPLAGTQQEAFCEEVEAMINKQILKNDFLQIEYLPDSARIMSFMPAGKSNLLADIPDFHPIATPYGPWLRRSMARTSSTSRNSCRG